MVVRHLYPRGFETPHKNTIDNVSIKQLKGDQELVRFYSKYIARHSSTKEWMHIKDLIWMAKRLFGPSFKLWVDYHLKSPYINPMSERFIEDTVRYLITGQRTAQALTWVDLIPTTLTKTSKDNNDIKTFDEIVKEYKLSQDEISDLDKLFVSKWLSNPNGFEDLIITTMVTYGPTPEKPDSNTTIPGSAKNPKLAQLLFGSN